MRKMYASPKLECTPVNTRELMETATVSVGGAGNQNLFNAPERGGIGAMLMVLLMLLPMSLFAAPTVAVDGRMPETFSVSATKVVYFSQGNLQYKANTQTWRFAENQYDFVGDATYGNVYEGGVKSNNANIGDSYTGWIDLFSWGTGAAPTNHSSSASDFSTFTDWGQNAISNGGNIANRWRTMSRDEWNYLLFQRTTTSNVRYAKATVNSIWGLIVLPDNWNTSYHSLTNANTSNANYTDNNISLAEWQSDFEAHGAVFIPTAGYREPSGALKHLDLDAICWTSTSASGTNAYDMYCYVDSKWLTGGQVSFQNHSKALGVSVRLVCEKYTVTYNGNGNTGGTVPTDNDQHLSQTSVIVQSGTPSKPYYTFVGWLNSVDGQTYAAGQNFLISGNTTLTAQWTADDITFDESDASITTLLIGLATDGTPHNMTITRSFVTGIYNTLCLPFSLTDVEIAASPLAGATLKDYNGADVSGEEAERDLNIHLTDLTEITAGKPFLIKPDVDIVNPTFTGVTVTYTAAMGELVERDHVDFQGILAPYDLAGAHSSSPDYLGIGMDGRLQWADASLSGGLPMRGFRAFFHVKDAGAAGSPVRRGMRAQFVEDSHKVPTAVDNTTAEQSQVRKIIRNGQVLIVRDGKLYNALGTELK